VNFTASWSAQCRFMAPVLADQAKNNTSVKFLKVDVDEVKVSKSNPNLSQIIKPNMIWVNLLEQY
jgi:thiol-disulfide isomerase/thioredoxin